MKIDEKLKIVCDSVRMIREWRGLSQKELSEQIGISPSSLNRIEKGHGNIRVETMIKIAEALDVYVSAIVGDIDGIGGELMMHRELNEEQRTAVEMVLRVLTSKEASEEEEVD